jgi:Ser-tRNA(Ala) deacylase AlaX
MQRWDDAQVNVVDVQKDEGGGVVVFVDASLPQNADVEVAVDWDRRYDLMQQHTGVPCRAPDCLTNLCYSTSHL